MTVLQESEFSVQEPLRPLLSVFVAHSRQKVVVVQVVKRAVNHEINRVGKRRLRFTQSQQAVQ